MSGSNPQFPRAVNAVPRRPRVLLAACGCMAADRFGVLCEGFLQWADVRAVTTQSSLHFLIRQSVPSSVQLFSDEHDTYNWRRIGDIVVHIELARWADIMVIAPLSANTLAKIAGGLCDNLLTCIVRAWDYRKPLFVAPSMNMRMWTNLLTEKNFMTIDKFGVQLIPPVRKRAASGVDDDYAMAEPDVIVSSVRERML